MYKKILGSLLCGICFATSAGAIPVLSHTWQWWGYDGSARDVNGNTETEFIIAGAKGQSGQHGTYGDEWGVVGVIATKVVEHGAYLCPLQLQCANKRKKRRSWTEYYYPNGFDWAKCAWLCSDGYGGEGCTTITSTPNICDKATYTTSGNGRFAGVSMKTWGGRSDMIEHAISGFNQFWSDPECDVILGVTKFLNHGVKAAPLQVCCGRNNWKSINSHVHSIQRATGNEKVLCSTGYKANAAGSDCEPINADMCDTQDLSFCANFDRTKYNSEIHRLELDAKSGCHKFFCKERGKAFPTAGDTSCTDCSSGVKGGSSPHNGVCIKCETGEAFNSETGNCDKAAAFSKIDLQYGKGLTKNSAPKDVNEQCWTATTPDVYAECIKTGKMPTVAENPGATTE